MKLNLRQVSSFFLFFFFFSLTFFWQASYCFPRLRLSAFVLHTAKKNNISWGALKTFSSSLLNVSLASIIQECLTRMCRLLCKHFALCVSSGTQHLSHVHKTRRLTVTRILTRGAVPSVEPSRLLFPRGNQTACSLSEKCHVRENVIICFHATEQISLSCPPSSSLRRTLPPHAN